MNRRLTFLLDQGIKFNLDEMDLFGLLNYNSCHVCSDVWYKWEDEEIFLSPLQNIMNTHHKKIPFLQVAVNTVAPPMVINEMIEHLDCIETVDSRGRYHFVMAMDKIFGWNNEGLKEMVQAFAAAKGRRVIDICAEYGYSWKYGMHKVLAETSSNDIETPDATTRLYPFMLAAAGDRSDLGSIFEIIKMSPGSVRFYDRSPCDISSSLSELDHEESSVVERPCKKMKTET